MSPPDFSNGTLAVRGGEEHPLALGAAQVPIFQSAAFAYPDIETWQAAALGQGHGRYLQPQQQSNRYGFRGKGPATRASRGGDLVRQRHGRHFQYLICSAATR